MFRIIDIFNFSFSFFLSFSSQHFLLLFLTRYFVSRFSAQSSSIVGTRSVSDLSVFKIQLIVSQQNEPFHFQVIRHKKSLCQSERKTDKNHEPKV